MTVAKKIIESVLEGGGVFVGHECCAPPRLRRPAVFRRLEDAGRFVHDPLCASSPARIALNLARKGERKIGMFLRACEARSIVECLKSRQMAREALYLHGVHCGGVVDLRLLRRRLESAGGGGGIASIREMEREFEVEFDGGLAVRVPKAEVVTARCFDCRSPGGLDPDSAEEGALVPVVIARPPSRPEETEDAFLLLVSECILCMACRSACACCFCLECVFDARMRRDLEPWMYHAARAMHIAGRCTGCGECERACPLGLPLQEIGRRVEAWIEDRFGFEGAGISLEAKAPLFDWRRED